MDSKSLRKRASALKLLDANKLRSNGGTLQKRPRHDVACESGYVLGEQEIKTHSVENCEEHVQFLDDNLVEKKQQNFPMRHYLDKEKINHLQQQLQILEMQGGSCHHYLCSIENRKMLQNFRLWFLFEMEVSYSSTENLRYSCYYNQTYRRIDSKWKLENLFTKDSGAKGIADNWKYQLIIPNLRYFGKGRQNIADIPFEFGDLHEFSLKIPHSLLSWRNKKEIFDEQPVSARDILQEPHEIILNTASTLAPENSCTLEKKLNLMNLPKKVDR